MKVYLSFDMEGISGIVDWAQCTGEGPAVALGQALTIAELNAVIEGALAAGASEVVVNDAHYRMQNLDPRLLAGRATYISGAHKPLYMMEGLDASFDVCFFVGYHGSISGPESVLSHSYSPAVFTELRVNGLEVGESGINALVALAVGVPIGLVSGDAATIEQARPVMPSAVMVQVKDSITRFAARNLHPEEAHELLREGAAEAVRRRRKESHPVLELPSLAPPYAIEMAFQTADQAEIASWAKGCERTGARSARIESTEPLAAYRSFVSVSYLTRQAQGR